MNIVIHQSNPHQTHDGLTGIYVVLFDASTAKRVGMLQVVELGDGTVQYRDTDKRCLPPDFTLDDAIRFAIADQKRRRVHRPARPTKPQPIRRHRLDPWYLPPKPIRPMRRLLSAKLAERNALKGAA